MASHFCELGNIWANYGLYVSYISLWLKQGPPGTHFFHFTGCPWGWCVCRKVRGKKDRNSRKMTQAIIQCTIAIPTITNITPVAIINPIFIIAIAPTPQVTRIRIWTSVRALALGLEWLEKLWYLISDFFHFGLGFFHWLCCIVNGNTTHSFSKI